MIEHASQRRMKIEAFPEEAAWRLGVAHKLQQVITAGRNGETRSRVAIAGGGTPRRFLAEVAVARGAESVCRIWPTDERAVNLGDGRRNDAILKDLLAPSPGLQIESMIGEPQTPQRMLRQVMRKLGHKAAPFSLIVLGMGEDGHIASLFPADQLAAWGQHPSGHCQWVQRRGEDFLRVSLGWQALREAEQVWLVLFGRAKMQALQSWLCSGDSSIPIVQLSQIRDLVVFWSP